MCREVKQVSLLRGCGWIPNLWVADPRGEGGGGAEAILTFPRIQKFAGSFSSPANASFCCFCVILNVNSFTRVSDYKFFCQYVVVEIRSFKWRRYRLQVVLPPSPSTTALSPGLIVFIADKYHNFWLLVHPWGVPVCGLSCVFDACNFQCVRIRFMLFNNFI